LRLTDRFKRYPKKEGYKVDSVTDGASAMRMIRSIRYDFVLSDLTLPDSGLHDENLVGDPPMILYTAGETVFGLLGTIKNSMMDMFSQCVADNTSVTDKMLYR